MSDDYTPGDYTATTEVIEADPTKPYKAYVSAAATAILAFIGYWVADDDPFTWKEAAEGFGIAVVASGLVGVPTFATRNPLRSRTITPADEVG